MTEEKKLLSAAEADRLIGCADGTAALLYLYILRTGRFSLTAAAGELKRSEADIALAANTLRRIGLLEPVKAPLPEREMPEYTAEDISRWAETDKAYVGVVREAEQALGRVLSSNDLNLLHGLNDTCGLPADVIMLLVNHCIEEYQLRYGAGRMPTMRYIEKEGWHWAELELLNLDTAEEYLEQVRLRRERAEQVKQVLQIHGRELTSTERRYVEDWLELGFRPEALAIAYDRTVSSTGKLAWKYMDKIIRSWNDKRLYTPEEIEQGDARRGGQRPASTPEPERSDSDKLDAMRRMYEHMQGREE